MDRWTCGIQHTLKPVSVQPAVHGWHEGRLTLGGMFELMVAMGQMVRLEVTLVDYNYWIDGVFRCSFDSSYWIDTVEPLLKDTLNKGHHRKYFYTKDTFLGPKNELSYNSYNIFHL